MVKTAPKRIIMNMALITLCCIDVRGDTNPAPGVSSSSGRSAHAVAAQRALLPATATSVPRSRRVSTTGTEFIGKLLTCYEQFVSTQYPVRVGGQGGAGMENSAPQNWFVISPGHSEYDDPHVVTPSGIFSIPLVRDPYPTFGRKSMTARLNHRSVVDIPNIGSFQLLFVPGVEGHRNTSAIRFEKVDKKAEGQRTLPVQVSQENLEQTPYFRDALTSFFTEFKTSFFELETYYANVIDSIDEVKWNERKRALQAQILAATNDRARNALQESLSTLEATRAGNLGSPNLMAEIESVRSHLLARPSFGASGAAWEQYRSERERRFKERFKACYDINVLK